MKEEISTEANFLMGYLDQISVAPGETIRCMVSSNSPTYDAEIVRLLHGDTNENGPGFLEQQLPSSISGSHRARVQPLISGSYVEISDRPTLRVTGSLTVQTWIYPTTPDRRLQGIFSKWCSETNEGYGLFVDNEGRLAFALGNGKDRTEWVRMKCALSPENWYFVAATYDATSRRVSLYQQVQGRGPVRDMESFAEQTLDPPEIIDSGAAICVAAYVDRLERKPRIAGHFNGKIENPSLFNRALNREEINSLAGFANPLTFESGLLGAWDFSQEITTPRVVDRSLHKHDGIAVNTPARAVTGVRWEGIMFTCFLNQPEGYAAMHFHDDDLSDAQWEEDFRFQVPDNLESGIYAVRLRSGDEDFYIPYVVTPKKEGPTAEIVFLAPTFTWQAYANFNEIDNPFNLSSEDSLPWLKEDYFIAAHPELGVSLYNLHSDGSTPFYSSRLRPNFSSGPKYKYAPLASAHLLCADLYITSWLREKTHQFDVVSDEDLHRRGYGVIQPYRVLITGAHPEYWTSQMLSGLEEFLNAGGNLMYMGGNGLYWVTSVDSTGPTIEVRRSLGTGLSRAADGELFHSTTGELGGIWRTRGKAPQKLVGVGFAAQGGAPGSPYRRFPASFDPRVSFIFEGVQANEMIGDFGLCTGAAAGFEIDRLDYALGTPPQTYLLASSENHHESYWHVVEETTIPGQHECGSACKKVRADMTFYEHPGGGGVFSAGSIAWAGSLSHEQYNNNVCTVTENVLNKFLRA